MKHGFFILAFCSFAAHAQQRFEFFQGARQMAMGGASIAVVDDETALIINPAGLGHLRESILTVLDPEVELNSTAQTAVGLKFAEGSDPQALLNDLNSHTNTPFHSKAQLFPSVVVPNFGFGVLGRTQTDAVVDSATSKYHYDYTNDYAFVLGANLRLLDGILKLGFDARVINRAEVHDHTLNSSSTNLTLDNMAAEGMGVAADAGAIVTLPWEWLPTFSAVYRDIGNTSYSAGPGMFRNTAARPLVTNHSLDAAVALFPIFANQTRGAFTAEYRDILTSGTEKDQLRRVHVGLEVNAEDLLFLRAGMNERFWTAGLEFDVGNYQMQLSSYGEEIGDYPVSLEDRRYVFKFSFRF